MAKKKDRAFFICPRWNEVPDTSRIGASGMTTPIHFNAKNLAAIKGGRPVARSTLRKALLAARQALWSQGREYHQVVFFCRMQASASTTRPCRSRLHDV